MDGDHGQSTGQRATTDEVVYRTGFDWGDVDQPAAALVETIARARDEDPLELDPLHDSLDPDALNQLFAGRSAGDGAGSVAFAVDGYRVRVERAGQVVVRADAPSGPTAPGSR